MIDPGVLSSHIFNFLVFALILTVPLLIGRDARQRGLSWIDTLVWILASLVLFPIGIGLYFLFGRPPARADSARKNPPR